MAEERLVIHPSAVQVSLCCYSPLSVGGRCSCGKPWLGLHVWFDESGDVMFMKLSDVRKKEKSHG